MFEEADNYERFMGRWSRGLAARFLEFAEVVDGEAVLDVGTGSGQLASEILTRFPAASVTGIDPWSSYVEHAASTIDDPRASFEVGDAQALRFEDGSFDRTVSMLVLNFIPDAPLAVSEMRRVTRPGGTVTASAWDYAGDMEMLRVFWDEAVALRPEADARDERHMPYCNREDLLELWQKAGFEDVEVTVVEVEQQFSTFDDYWQPFMLGTGPAGAYVASLAEPDRTALRERLRSRLTGDPGEAIVLHSSAWAVRGRVD